MLRALSPFNRVLTNILEVLVSLMGLWQTKHTLKALVLSMGFATHKTHSERACPFKKGCEGQNTF